MKIKLETDFSTDGKDSIGNPIFLLKDFSISWEGEVPEDIDERKAAIMAFMALGTNLCMNNEDGFDSMLIDLMFLIKHTQVASEEMNEKPKKGQCVEA